METPDSWRARGKGWGGGGRGKRVPLVTKTRWTEIKRVLLTFIFGSNYPRDPAQPEEKKFCRSLISLLASFDFSNKRKLRNSSTLVSLSLIILSQRIITIYYYDCANVTFVWTACTTVISLQGSICMAQCLAKVLDIIYIISRLQIDWRWPVTTTLFIRKVK